MYQPVLVALRPWTDGATAKTLSGPNADDEAEYCLVRASVEARRAAEATHPAAQSAHEQMAALYHQRALDAHGDAGEIPGWLGEGGNFFANYG